MKRSDEEIHLYAGVQTAQRANSSLARLALLVAIGLNEEGVAPVHSLGDLDEHGERIPNSEKVSNYFLL